MYAGALERPQRRALLLGSGIAGGLIALSGWLTSCSTLPDAHCAPCQSTCPSDLQCNEAGRCVRSVDDRDCDALATATDGTTPSSGGSGGAGPGGGGTGGTGTDGAAGEGAAGSPMVPSSVTTSGGSIDCADEQAACTAEFKSSRTLPAVCSGSEIDVQLEAGCKCDDEEAHHSVTWEADSLPPELTLTSSGRLFGLLPDGTHRFSMTANVDGNADPVSSEFEVTVLERCLVLFVTSESTTAPVELAAARIDSGARVPLPTVAPLESTLASFDVSPDGRFLAEVTESASGRALYLVELGDAEPEAVTLEYNGDYVAHAFSRDSHWLGLLTTTVDEQAQTQIELVDLSSNTKRVVDVESVDYLDGLSWSDAGGLLYRQKWPEDTRYRIATEHRVGPSGFGSKQSYSGTRMFNDSQFYRFLVNDSGFFMLSEGTVPYFDRARGEAVVHPTLEALAPDLEWVAQLDSRGVWVTRAAEPSSSTTRRAGCDYLRAWSADASRLLCTLNHEPTVYDVVEDGVLERAAVMTGIFDSQIRRAAFSDNGRWLALAPTNAGLLIMSQEEFATRAFDQTTLEPPSGKNEWDYFFTPDGTRLVVQRGRSLLVAALDEKTRLTEADFEDLEVTLSEVPDCETGWFPELDHWCGAPRYRGNVLLSPAGRHIAFEDAEGTLHVASVDVHGDRPKTVSVGRVTDLAASEKFVFQ